MVQVIENWAYVVGRLGPLITAAGSAASGVIDIEEVRDAEGWPNLLAQFAGQRLSVHVPETVHGQWKDGARMVLRARLGGPGIVWVSGDPGDLRPAE